MQIGELPIPSVVKEFYDRRGFAELYPPQEDAIWAGLLDGVNLLAAVPTASGKTLIAELAMLSHVLDGGKALYIVPLRALASEKYQRFKEFSEIGVSVGVSTGDLDSRDEWLADRDIIVATSEKVDSLLRNRASWISELTVVVADEVHLIDSASRGPTLEVVLALLQRMGDIQIIALSATIGNPREVAEWLGARPITGTWRPVELREGVAIGSAINYQDGEGHKVERIAGGDETVNLVAETLREGGQSLVFDSTRRNAEASAKRISKAIKNLLDDETLSALREVASRIMETSETDTTRTLARCVAGGAAFHHAGLGSGQRSIIEDAYREGTLKVISSTPTLAAGLNLPARRVIIRGYKRYDPNYGALPIPVLEYKQMAGRAGRPGLDPYGEAITITRSPEEAEWVSENYLNGKPERVWSKLASEPALRSHLLSLIATGFAERLDELYEFMRRTFYAHQQDLWSMRTNLELTLEFLADAGMIKMAGENLYPTELGLLTSQLYLDPLSAKIIKDELEEEDEMKMTDLGILQLISRTPDMPRLYMRRSDYRLVEEFIKEHQHKLLPPKDEDEWYLAEVKTASLLYEWINEVPENEICTKYKIGEGDIRRLSETAEWITHAGGRIARTIRPQKAEAFHELTERITHGAQRELIPLIQLREIGRVRARKLYNAGYRTPDDARRANHEELARIIGPKIAEKIMKQLHEERPGS